MTLMALHLKRVKQTPFATYGRLYAEDGTEICVTLERPWKENQHIVSCIPAGNFRGFRYLSPRRGRTLWMLADVPDRTAIEIHSGNLPRDSEGCILVGSAFGEVDGQPGITGSKTALAKLMTETQYAEALALGISDPDAPAPVGSMA